MKRGTTPTHIFEFPFETELISKLKIIYAQDDVVIFCKTEADCTLEEQTASVRLTQEETLKFDCKKSVQIQVRVLTKGGDALVSPIRLYSVDKCLESEVLK